MHLHNFICIGLLIYLYITFHCITSVGQAHRIIILCDDNFLGTPLGTVAAFQVGGILGASAWGWPSTFWVTGVLCLVAFTMLSIFGSSSPSCHKSISENEKNFILGRVKTIDDDVKAVRTFDISVKKMLCFNIDWISIASKANIL